MRWCERKREKRKGSMKAQERVRSCESGRRGSLRCGPVPPRPNCHVVPAGGLGWGEREREGRPTTNNGGM